MGRLVVVKSNPQRAQEMPGSTLLNPTAWRVQVLRSVDEIEPFEPHWLALERETSDPFAAFQSYSWCIAWAKAFCTGKGGAPQPHIFAVYRNEELVALLPMMSQTRAGVRVLSLFGEPHSQIAGALTHPGVDCGPGLRLCLVKARADRSLDAIALGPIPEGSQLSNALDETGLSSHHASHLSMIEWPGIWRADDYLAALSKNRRKDFNNKKRRLEKLGSVSFKRYDAGSPEFRKYAETAIVWKRNWLTRNGKVSAALSADGMIDFMIGLRSQTGGFIPEIEVLSANETPVAISINLVGREIRNCYLSGYDESFAHVSPGTLAHQYAIHQSIEDGMSAYSLLGHPTHFKNLWANKKPPLKQVLVPLNWRGRLWISGWRELAKPRIKSVMNRLSQMRFVPFLGPVAKHIINILPKIGRS